MEQRVLVRLIAITAYAPLDMQVDLVTKATTSKGDSTFDQLWIRLQMNWILSLFFGALLINFTITL